MKYLFWLCFSFKGRISRKTFWIYAVASLFIHQALKEIPVALMELDPALEGTRDLVIAFGLLMFFKIIIIDMAVISKHLQDTNRHGWQFALLLIPIIGWLYVFIICGFFKGTDGENRVPNQRGDEFRIQCT